MLNGLIEGFGGTKTLVLVNYRPEYAPAWGEDPAWRRSSWSRCDRDDTRELLRDLAGEDPSLDGLDEPIHERTGGNPFFIEEIVRELAECRLPGGRARRLPPRQADRGRGRPGHRAGGAGGADRPPRATTPSTCCRSPRCSARRSAPRRWMTAGLDEEAMEPRPARADRGRLPLRSRDLPAAAARLPPPAHPRGRLRHPARRAAGRHPRGGGAGADRAEPARPLRRAGGADRRPPASRAARRWKRRAGRPAPPTGPATAAPTTRCASGTT